MEIYLDSSATTRPRAEVIALMSDILYNHYGNPSSAHLKGLEAEKILRRGREAVAEALKCRADEVFFTSGGTEANNLAIKGAALRHRRRGNHIITSSIEHPSVLNCCRFLEESGFSISYLPVDRMGYVRLDKLESMLGEETILVSIIHVNNETGTIQPLSQIGALIKRNNPKTLFHIDGVQSFGKIPLNLSAWSADLFSCSAHKIHGPKGVGVLWVKKNTLLQPLFQGGAQEGNLRPGTENVAGIAGFGLAASLAFTRLEHDTLAMQKAKEKLFTFLNESGITVKLNGPPLTESAPHIINLSFPQIKAEVLLHALESKGVYVSAGSACHSRHPEPSHVLQEMGLTGEELAGAIRFSFSGYTTEKEVQIAAALTADAVKEYALL